MRFLKSLTFLFGTSLTIILSACNSNSGCSNGAIECDRLTINLNPKFYDEVINNSERPKMVALKEDDNTLFADARKVIVRNGKIIILDQFDGRTVVSFTMDGEPYAHYGKVGNGPGEYFMPMDIDTDSTGVYVLSTNTKKLIKYTFEGDFIGCFELPFFAKTFTLLDNGNFLFSLAENGTAMPRLCATDTTVTDIKYHLSYPKGYVGGWGTDHAINKTPRIATFYKVPADTIFILNSEGAPYKGIVLDFNGRSVSEEAKLDFNSYGDRDIDNGAIMLGDNPFPLANGLWVGSVEDKDNRYNIIFDPVKNICGGREDITSTTKPYSVYDIHWQCGIDDKGNLISLLDEYMASKCHDFDSLDDEIKEALHNGNRVLLFHNLKYPEE